MRTAHTVGLTVATFAMVVPSVAIRDRLVSPMEWRLVRADSHLRLACR